LSPICDGWKTHNGGYLVVKPAQPTGVGKHFPELRRRRRGCGAGYK